MVSRTQIDDIKGFLLNLPVFGWAGMAASGIIVVLANSLRGTLVLIIDVSLVVFCDLRLGEGTVTCGI